MANVKKVVIIGGGMSGLAAAFGLTSAPNWQEQYEITVLQLGWRLGGKGASGRNAALQQRIEEHGLHIWGGFYENAFRVMRACYTEMNRPANAPLATWDEAFKPSPLVSWMEELNGWLAWNNSFPLYPSSTPGDGTPMPTLLDGVLRIIEWVVQTALEPEFAGAMNGVASVNSLRAKSATSRPAWVDRVVAAARATAGPVSSPIVAAAVAQNEAVLPSSPALECIIDAHTILRSAPADSTTHSPELHGATAWLLRAFRSALPPVTSEAAGAGAGLRRAGILVDLCLAEGIGILEDGLFISGFDVIDNEDYMAWLTRHGASPAAVNSAVVRGVYDFIFAYRHGDPTQPALGAGAGLRCVLRLVMWYKGAIFWKMQAGMGDVVFAPLYQVLQNRGVNIQFFQKVENLGLSADKSTIATIQVGEQATLVNGTYNPLYDVSGLPCWPDVPFYDQLVQGQQLQEQGIDLEDPWADWTPVNQYTLVAGVDFDTVILATSMGPLAEICTELIAASPAWTNMVQNVETVQTQAFQLWMTPTLADLGWTAGSPVLTAYAHPEETWSDMSQLIVREVWPPGQAPGSVAYFCGPLIDATPIPPYTDHQFPAQQAAIVQQTSIDWINSNIPTIWPNAGTAGAFNWALVDDPTGGSGSARFNSQYWRANLSPAERYVLTVPGSTQYRMKAADSGFANLYLAGDWTLNGLNFGCIESATMGGLEVSQAICGYPTEIVGETDV
ncbi:MAG: NAD(P)-binding protein [bacterium]